MCSDSCEKINIQPALLVIKIWCEHIMFLHKANLRSLNCENNTESHTKSLLPYGYIAIVLE